LTWRDFPFFLKYGKTGWRKIMPINVNVSPSADFSLGSFVDLIEWIALGSAIGFTDSTTFTASGIFNGQATVVTVVGTGFSQANVGGVDYVVSGVIDTVTMSQSGNLIMTATNVYIDLAVLGPIVIADNAGTDPFGIENFMMGLDWNYSGSDLADIAPSGTLVGDGAVFNLTGVDTINGNGGDDELFSGDGIDTVNGGSGDDTIEGGADGDILDGGTNTAVGDTLSYASSDAGVTVYLASNTVTGGHATGDMVMGFENVTGSGHADFLFGDAGANTINGNGGADWIYGGAEDDTLNGGAGADLMFGEAGADTMNGGDDGDYMWGGDQNDVMHGNDGIDWLRGENGADTLYGDIGDDILIGGADDDNMYGGTGTDTFFGEGENDFIYGEANGDVAFGQDGNDYISGGSEGDFLFGGDGFDSINGGTENDLMWGDMPGSFDGMRDTFEFEAGWGFDAIYDFELGIDQVAFHQSAGPTQFSDLTIYDGGANVTVAYGADAITLYGVTLAELNANQADFVFNFVPV
jgi:Ca2+-binding RTX toxin-like protein